MAKDKLTTRLQATTITAFAPTTILPGVGTQIAQKLAELGIHSLQDLIFHLPYHYQDRTRITAISDLRVGAEVLIEARVFAVRIVPGRKPNLTVELIDGTGAIELKFFHFNKDQYAQFKTLPLLRCYGEVKAGYKRYCIMHPEYQIINSETEQALAENLDPVYPNTAGLSQKWLRKLIQQAVQLALDQQLLSEYLSAEILKKYNLLSLTAAIKILHAPPPDISRQELANFSHPAQQRLIFEELLANNLALRKLRNLQRARQAVVIKNQNEQILAQLYQNLPFNLTAAQQRVLQEIQQDLACGQPMLRLLQGDVGSGKTVVALAAMLFAVSSGYQAALMAPTELLAEQHYRNISQYLTGIGISVQLLIAKTKDAEKKNIKLALKNQELSIVIGTHALLQKDVDFANLALVVIDEQHRFGVEQRLGLWEKGQHGEKSAHQLIMTATPIPRTLAMTSYANLDYSVLDELPQGRKPIKTVALSNQRRMEVLSRVRLACQEGGQAYWVCTLISESEFLNCQAAEKTWEILCTELCDCRVGLIHSKMSAADKEKVMADFKNAQIQVLVATTVIEVGIDVPNANLMVIENPERLGLAQLHQLRGRVGRGKQQSYCVLLHGSPLSDQAYQRLDTLRNCNDGFAIAQKDWQLRGSGELLGKRQAGIWQLKIADLSRDHFILEKVKEVAEILQQQDQNMVDALIKRWLINREQYGAV